MKIFISGGVGFIASHIAEYYALQNKDNKIYLIDSLYKDIYINKGKAKYYNKDYLERYNNITFIHRDIRNFEAMCDFFRDHQIDVVFHTAGQVATTTSIKKPSKDFSMNVIGTYNLLEAVRRTDSNPIFIFLSTNKVYGDQINKLGIIEKEKRYEFKNMIGISESSNIDQSFRSPYGTSKLCADLYCQEYGYTYGLKVGIFRMSCIYGIRQMGYEDQGWIAHFIISSLQNKTIKIYGDGKQLRDILYISDLINAYDSFINNPSNKIYNIGGGELNTLSLLELINFLEDILQKEIKVKFYRWRLGDQKVYVSDITKVCSELKWKPIITPEKGVKILVDWFKEFYSIQD